MDISYDLYSNQVIGKFFLHFVFLFLLLLFFSKWLPKRRKGEFVTGQFRKEYQEDKALVIADIILGITFFVLCIASMLLLFLPNGAAFLRESHASPIALQGTVERVETRHFIWAPYYGEEHRGGYVFLNGKRFYRAHGEAFSVGDEVCVSYLPESKYVLHYDNLSASAPNTPLSRPWYETALWWGMVASGLYLLVRLLVIAGKEAIARRRELDQFLPPKPPWLP